MSWEAPPPDPTNPDVMDNLRQYLINAGLVRDPRDAANQGKLPTMWIAPRFGVPAPGQTEGLNSVESEPVGAGNPGVVVALLPATDVPPARYEGFLRNYHVEIFYRSRTPQPAIALENKIRAAINDKRGWTMVNVPVNESLLFRGLQPIGSDQIAFNFTQEYQFSLWGPFTPIS